MFDIGFFELLLIATLGLVVIGPERLPGAVRTFALWVGRIKRSFRATKSEFERAIGADDIRRQLHNEEVLQQLEEAKASLQTVQQSALSSGLSSGDAMSQVDTANASLETHKTLPSSETSATDDKAVVKESKESH